MGKAPKIAAPEENPKTKQHLGTFSAPPPLCLVGPAARAARPGRASCPCCRARPEACPARDAAALRWCPIRKSGCAGVGTLVGDAWLRGRAQVPVREPNASATLGRVGAWCRDSRALLLLQRVGDGAGHAKGHAKGVQLRVSLLTVSCARSRALATRAMSIGGSVQAEAGEERQNDRQAVFCLPAEAPNLPHFPRVSAALVSRVARHGRLCWLTTSDPCSTLEPPKMLWSEQKDKYIDKTTYRNTVPPEKKKKGFMSGDFPRRDEFSNTIRTSQLREVLKVRR